MNHAGAAAFYPVVPHVAWVRRLLPLGVRTLQLRLKDAAPQEVHAQVREAVALGRAHGAQVVVNDHWQAALAAGAAHVHLGQQDLDGADVPALRAAGVALGVSTHSPEELERALRLPVAYVALGPVYATTLKAMPWAPQGLARVREWKARVRCPLVAIGGITLERAPAVLAAGADVVAVVGDVVAHPLPEARVAAWLRLVEERGRAAPVAAGEGP